MKAIRSVLILPVLFFSIGTAWAGDKFLTLSSYNPTGRAIELTFSNNVVNFSVAEGNSQSFSLKTVAGEDVDFAVEMADDQMEPELKRIVKIVPVRPFVPGNGYILTISGEFRSKNGQTLGDDITVSFTAGTDVP